MTATTLRMTRTGRVVYSAFGAAELFGLGLVASAFASAAIGSQALTICILAALVATLVWVSRVFGTHVVYDANGLLVRNLVRTRDLGWSDVAELYLGRSGPNGRVLNPAEPTVFAKLHNGDDVPLSATYGMLPSDSKLADLTAFAVAERVQVRSPLASP